MSKSSPTPLTMPLIPKKGEALPAISSFEEQAPPVPSQDAVNHAEPVPRATPPSPRLFSRVQATIAVTVRLDEPRYERMKGWGTTGRRRVTNQEIIVAALDRFFALSDEEREEGIVRARR